MEIRLVDPRTLKANPNNPRKTKPGEHADQQLVANIKAVGITQPPVVRVKGDDLVVVAGDRRVAVAIEAGFEKIYVLVRDGARPSPNSRVTSRHFASVAMKRGFLAGRRSFGATIDISSDDPFVFERYLKKTL